nr:hypothetical protein [uncultured bacterium]
MMAERTATLQEIEQETRTYSKGNGDPGRQRVASHANILSSLEGEGRDSLPLVTPGLEIELSTDKGCNYLPAELAFEDPVEQFVACARAGRLTGSLHYRYATIVYSRADSYEETVRRRGLDGPRRRNEGDKQL